MKTQAQDTAVLELGAGLPVPEPAVASPAVQASVPDVGPAQRVVKLQRSRPSVGSMVSRVVAPFVAALVASAGVFFLAAVSPHNPLANMVDNWEFASAQTKAELEAAYASSGWVGAWWSWLHTLMTTGDAGYSRVLQQPVTEILMVRGVNTLASTIAAGLMCAGVC